MSLSYGAKLDRIRAGLDVVKLAEQKLASEAVQLLQRGDLVWWRRGRFQHRGTVLSVSFAGRCIMVENARTQKRLSIRFCELIEGPAS